MVAPGIPDFLTRMRILDRRKIRIEGRAWSGRAQIRTVEVSTDGGLSWAKAEVEASRDNHSYAWQAWRYDWDARTRGLFELVCRATDSNGAVQPLEQFWTARGMGNNMVHRVKVQVR